MFFKNYGPPRSTRQKPTVHGTLIYGPPRSTCEKTTVHGPPRHKPLYFHISLASGLFEAGYPRVSSGQSTNSVDVHGVQWGTNLFVIPSQAPIANKRWDGLSIGSAHTRLPHTLALEVVY